MRAQVTHTKGLTIQQLIGKLERPQVFLDRVGQILQASTRERLEKTKQSPDGAPWAPWRPSTARARAKDGSASKGLLYRTGVLSQSIEYQVSGNRVTVGANTSKAPYAVFLQGGTTRMVARPFVGISSTDQQVIRKALQTFLSGV